MPPQKKMPILSSVIAKPGDEDVRLELDACLKALEAATRRNLEASKE